jgi:mRNA interferase RelE/StbE
VTASYNVIFRRSAEKELRGVPKADLGRITAEIRGLGTDPRPHGCEKLVASDHYRLRQGDWRVVHAVDDRSKTVTIVKIGNRREVYR